MANKQTFLPPLWIISLLAILIVGWFLMKLDALVALLVVGYAVAYVINPWLTNLQRRGISRTWGVLLIMLGIAVLLTVLALTALPTIVREYSRLSQNFSGYVETARTRVGPLLEGVQAIIPPDIINLSAINGEQLGSFSEIAGETIKRAFSTVSGALISGYSLTMWLANLLLLPFIVFYVAVDFHMIHQRGLTLFPLITRAKVKSIFTEIDQLVSAFVRGQLTVCFTLFVLYAIGLKLVGVELWFLLAFISGFGNLVPYLGFLSGILLSSVMALVTFGDFSHLLGVWVVYAVVQALEGIVITPKIVGDKLGISPLVVILAVFAGGALCGLLGVFFAVPAVAILKVLLKHAISWAHQEA